MELLLLAAINILFDVADAANNSANQKYNNVSSNVITLPVIATDDVSGETIKTYAKSMEVVYAYMIKMLVEGANRTRFDSDIKTIYTQLPVRTSLDASWLTRFMSTLTFGAFNRKGANLSSDAMIAFAESAMFSIQQSVAEGKSVLAGGESMEAIYGESRTAVPTFVACEVPVSTLGRITTKTITVGIKCTPKILSTTEMLQFLTTNSSNFLNVVNSEKALWNMNKIRAKLLESRVKSTKNTLGADYGKLTAMMNKVKNSPKPFVNLLMSKDVYDMAVQNKFNLINPSDYSRLFNKYPIASVGIINTDIDVLEYSMGPVPVFQKSTIEDFTSDVSKYEKELRSVIKFNKYS